MVLLRMTWHPKGTLIDPGHQHLCHQTSVPALSPSENLESVFSINFNFSYLKLPSKVIFYVLFLAPFLKMISYIIMIKNEIDK